MKPVLKLHYLVKREPQGYWAAYCLDFTLYAVGDTADEAKTKLDDQVKEYIRDAVIGPDAPYGNQLLSRSAPIRDWIAFYALFALQSVMRWGDHLHRTASTPIMPLIPPNAHA